MSAWSGASGSPAGAGMRSTMASSSSGTPSPGLGRDVEDGRRRRCPRTCSISAAAPLGVGGGQVDLVEDGHDLEVVLERLVAVGQGLGLDALGGVDQQHRPLAGGQRPAHLVAEVDVAGGVDEMEGVVPPAAPARSGP